jgi:hypothetical protein
VLRKLDIHMQNNEIGFLSHTISKNQFNMERPDIVRLLEENIRQKSS